MKDVYGYIRVSTAKQGEKGVSLREQKDAITRYAHLNNLNIIFWFEERETAAKRGRTEFTKMMTLLRARTATGVVIHKIDRSARNLRDWAELVDLADQGIDVFFVNESIDMGVRGGRLSADIQAVVAADYIRNLREETIKGLRGRLKQGLYPWGAPIGYLNMGSGQVKAIDPMKGPVIKELFERYATGEYTLKELLRYARNRGLSNKYNKPISMSGLSSLLHNPFYTGVIYIKRMDETFAGKHEPIVSQDIYNKVQMVLQGKSIKGNGKHDHAFRRMITCSDCNRSLIGEKQKGRVYYRCHKCRGVSIREDAIEQAISEILAPFKLCEHEIEEIEDALRISLVSDKNNLAAVKKANDLEHDALQSRLSKLTDAYIDETIDKNLYLKKKNELLRKIQSIVVNTSDISRGISDRQQVITKHLELYKTAYFSYSKGNPSQRRQLLKELTSNRSISQKYLTFKLYSPFKELCDAKKSLSCAHCREWSRTFRKKGTKKQTFGDMLKEWVRSCIARSLEKDLASIRKNEAYLKKVAHRKRYAHSYESMKKINERRWGKKFRPEEGSQSP